MNISLNIKPQCPMCNIIQHQDSITTLFCVTDDLCKTFLPKNLPNSSPAGRKNVLSISELITLSVLFLYSDCKSFKGFYQIFKYTNFFPKLPEYSRLLKNLKSVCPQIMLILNILLDLNRSKDTKDKIKIIDTLPLPVVNNKRIFNYSVSDLAARGKSSMGWFYGFKLHIVCNERGELLRVKITPGNVSDKDQQIVMEMFKDLEGLALGDAGYVSESLKSKLLKEGLFFLAGSYKNMKKLITKTQHKLLRLRQRIESVNANIKHRQGCASSLPRSFIGYMWRYLTAVLSFMLISQYC